MSYRPNTTIYLCAGTGMDMANSIWWYPYAYPIGTDEEVYSWWTTCFAWFKSHSIYNGHWYCSYVDVEKRVVRVGRTPLNNGSVPKGEAGLGSASKQVQIDNPNTPFVEAIRAVDYIIIANENGEVHYAFVTQLSHVNHNTADVSFEVDALMTYQKYFHLGKCLVNRDMQHQEREGSSTGIPIVENINIKPEPFLPQDDDYVFRQMEVAPELTDLGKYSDCFVVTDIDLQPQSITPNSFYGGIPSFKPSGFTKYIDVNLGIGIYYIPERINEAFTLLGSYNAMEHILYTYIVPSGLVLDSKKIGNNPIFINNFNAWMDRMFTDHDIKIPNTFADLPYLREGLEGYEPLNLKCYNAPFRYFAITDKQGGSLEITPQSLYELKSEQDAYYNLELFFRPNIAPNSGSTLEVKNTLQLRGSYTDPFVSIWQIPSYSMTPNNSGYNNNFVNAVYQKNMSQFMMVIGGAITASAGVLDIAGTVAGMAIGGAASGGMQGVSQAMGSRAGANIGSAATGLISQTYNQIGAGITGGGVTALNAAVNNKYSGEAKTVFGLPKVTGGLPQGGTWVSMIDPGYAFYCVHWKTELIKQLDLLLSLYGYNQEVFRYPHINTRKRWTFVSLKDVNIMTHQADQYNMSGVPFKMRQQIEDRLRNGVTFWNVRYALMGENDKGQSNVNSYDDARITSNNNLQFVKYYGKEYDSTIMKENLSYTGGYADEYTDEF